MRRKAAHALFLLLAFVFAALPAAGEIASDEEWGFSLDLPAGYKIAEVGDDGLSAMFTHGKIPVTVASRVYKDASNAESTLRGAMRKLPNRYFDISAVPYRRGQAAVSCFDMTLDGEKEGWAVCAPLFVKGGYVVVIAYAPSAASASGQSGKGEGGETPLSGLEQQIIISILNSLTTDKGSAREAGIMTRFAYPASGSKAIRLEIGGKGIDTSIDASDADAADFVVGTEYAVLSLYAKSPLYQEAWKRYYRAIFRDALGRIKGPADDIYKALREGAGKPQNEGYYLASALLSWVQNMPYARGDNSADFTSLPRALAGGGSDCDTRSLLLASLLDCMGFRCAIFVSPVFSHALFGIDIPPAKEGEGASLKCGEGEYLLGETTAHGVPLGMVAQEHRDAKKWMGIPLGE